MKNLTKIKGVKINFVEFDTTKNWIDEFPNKDWSVVIFADVLNRNYFDEIIRKVIDRNVLWISSVGKQQDLIHDMSDDEILIRDIENGYLPNHDIMTIGVTDLIDGLFSGIFLPIQSEENIQEIVIIDVEKLNYNKIISAIEKLQKEYT
ncbi:hypothetical protein [Flavobacterium sp.]|uniref:hypothetical protein n=1 Tax=Flavobacterium sp. TaxID=239 RepID=UPI000EDA3055|nr:hypothetical protein [Flavobacterium sp.]HCQ12097.1 hypothetical protein [Flavobacterium sp.]